MTPFICTTCGTQHAESAEPPASCAICQDERQYIGLHGQQWTTLEALAETHAIRLRPLDPGIVSVEVEPAFAIGQRALLVAHPEGNVLWDCVPLIDQQTVDAVEALGGLKAIAISHPHFYSCFAEWSRAFGDVPVYLQTADAAWVMRPDDRVTFWAGDTFPLADGIALVRAGGHFEGSSLLHWAAGAGGRGALLVGDTMKVGLDRQSVSVMRSYPNAIPVGAKTIRQVAAALELLEYDRVYGAWPGHVVASDARAVVRRSLERYLARISE